MLTFGMLRGLSRCTSLLAHAEGGKPASGGALPRSGAMLLIAWRPRDELERQQSAARSCTGRWIGCAERANGEPDRRA